MFKKSITFSVVLAMAWGYPTGAPPVACSEMTPHHPAEPQTNALPYSISVSKQEVQPGDTVTITIGGKAFKGFLMQVRDGDNAVGTFNISNTDPSAQTLRCHDKDGSAATHKNNELKNEVVLQWQAPNDSGSYQIFVTVVQQFTTFWARQPSEKIKVG